jgi:hypothetical protein
MAKVKIEGDMVTIGTKVYSFEDLRFRAINFFPNALRKHYIKCIETSQGRKFTYDWKGFLHSQGKINPDLPDYFWNMEDFYFDSKICPVPGLSTDIYSHPKGIHEIYKAIKKSFVFVDDTKINKNGIHQAHVPLEIVSNRNISKSTALTIYVGICVMHDFSLQEAAELIGANPSELNDHWGWFEDLIRTAIQNDPELSTSRLLRATTVYNKTLLVLNYLRLNCGSFLANELGHLH